MESGHTSYITEVIGNHLISTGNLSWNVILSGDFNGGWNHH